MSSAVIDQSPPAMFMLQRITTQYDPAEDRIGVTGMDAGGQTVVLWLTQRLLNQLVARLCQGLEHTDPRPSQSAVLQHSFAQQRAHAALPRQSAVVPQPGAPQWRVDRIDVHQSAGGVRLTLKGQEVDAAARLRLSTPALRQWLGMVYRQYRLAGWALGVWPAWMEEAQMPTVRPTALH